MERENLRREVLLGVRKRTFFYEFELYWGAVRFLKSNWSGDFGHAETGNGAQKRVILPREIFSLLF